MSNHSIYKFYTLNINALSALAAHTIWFSEQSSLNDPFEGIIKIIKPETQEELIEQAISYAVDCLLQENDITNEQAKEIAMAGYISNPEEFIEKTSQNAVELHNQLKGHAKSMSVFSTASDFPKAPPQISNVLLWSHYGDGFKGFCVEFDRDKLFESVKDLNKDADFGITAVDYISKPREIKLFSNDNPSAMSKAIQCKHIQWEYECEVRLVSSITGLTRFSPEAVKSVYIGFKMPALEEKLLISVLENKYPNAAIKKVTADNETFGVRVGEKI